MVEKGREIGKLTKLCTKQYVFMKRRGERDER